MRKNNEIVMHNNENQPSRQSKTQIKEDYQRLFLLAETLVNLPKAQFAKLILEDLVKSEIEFARSISSYGAKKRQLQYLAKVIRQNSPIEILTKLEKLNIKLPDELLKLHQSSFKVEESIDEEL